MTARFWSFQSPVHHSARTNSLIQFIPIISAAIWLFPPLRQYKSFFFLYFLILAVVDLIVVTSLYFFNTQLFLLYPIASILILVSLQRREFISQNWIIIAVVGLIAMAFPLFIHSEGLQYTLIIFIHTAVMIRMLHLFILNIADNRWINFYYVALVFYELTVILKFVNYLTGLINAYDYFIFTTIFEITLGLFFILFREDNRRIVLQLK